LDVGPKRDGSGGGSDLNGRLEEAVTATAALRAAADVAQAPTDARTEKKEDERISLFWRVFGGAILSICALISITIFNNVSSTLSELRSEISKASEARANIVAEMVRKEEFNSRMTSNWDRLQGLQQQNNSQNATLTSLKTELDGLKERLTKQAYDGEGLRRDSAAAVDAVKRDLATMEVLRERLTSLTQELKGTRDDIQKLRSDVDRNQAYDLERKELRDVQYKYVEETLKELQRAVQDCREKLARLEGQYGPPSQPAPKKASSPRPTPKEERETAPMPSQSAPPIPPSKDEK
jgi:DNA repair exonuclease SbcCD ATPase subunit